MAEFTSFLSEAYYALGITVICVGLIVWLANLQGSVKSEAELRAREQKNETEARTEAIRQLTEFILRVEKVSAVEVNKVNLRFEDLETKGPRALSERVSLLIQQITMHDDRCDEIYKGLIEVQKNLRDVEMVANRLTDRLTESRFDEINRRLLSIEQRQRMIRDE